MKETPARTPVLKLAGTPARTPARKLLDLDSKTPPKLDCNEDDNIPSTQPEPAEPPSPVHSCEDAQWSRWDKGGRGWQLADWGWSQQRWWQSGSWEWDQRRSHRWEEDDWDVRSSRCGYDKAMSSSDLSSTDSPKRASVRNELRRARTSNGDLYKVQEEAAEVEDELERDLAKLIEDEGILECDKHKLSVRMDTQSTLKIDPATYDDIANSWKDTQQDTQQQDTQRQDASSEPKNNEAAASLQLCRASPMDTTEVPAEAMDGPKPAEPASDQKQTPPNQQNSEPTGAEPASDHKQTPPNQQNSEPTGAEPATDQKQAPPEQQNSEPAAEPATDQKQTPPNQQNSKPAAEPATDQKQTPPNQQNSKPEASGSGQTPAPEPEKACKEEPEDSAWRCDKRGKPLSPAALYSRFYRSARSRGHSFIHFSVYIYIYYNNI